MSPVRAALTTVSLIVTVALLIVYTYTLPSSNHYTGVNCLLNCVSLRGCSIAAPLSSSQRIISTEQVTNHRESLMKRRLASSEPKIDYGSQTVLPSLSVFANIVRTEKHTYYYLHDHHHRHQQQQQHQQHQQQNTDSMIKEVLSSRQRNLEKLKKLLSPLLAATEWPAISTFPCPHFQDNALTSRSMQSHNHRLERGHGLSHMQTWLEFLFFDNDVLDAMHRPYPEFITSNSYSSVSGIFSAESNGSLYKNGVPFLEEDVLIVLEDTARAAVANITTALAEELRSHMAKESNVDMLSLGWYHHQQQQQQQPMTQLQHQHRQLQQQQQPMLKLQQQQHNQQQYHFKQQQRQLTESTVASTSRHIATYAYAITRRAARKLLHHYDVCGRPLAEQLQLMIRNHHLNHRFAISDRYQQLQFDTQLGDLSAGLFKQPPRLLWGESST